MSRFQKLAWTTVGATLALITLGALVRATGSGDACPDWPTCFGKWVPPMRRGALIEYSHRLAASLVGTLVLLTAIAAWLKQRTNRIVFWPSLAALVMIGIQAWIGREVVVGHLPRDLVALHLFTSLTVLGLLALAAAGSLLPRGGRFGTSAYLALGAAVLSFSVIMLGAFVTQYNAALVFHDWPLMDGGLAPPRPGPAMLHYLHRVDAALLGFLLAGLAFRATRQKPKDRLLVKLAHGAFGLWLLQAVVGGLNVLARSPAWAIVLHVSAGALVWATLVVSVLVAYRRATFAEPQEQPAPQAPGLVQAREGLSGAQSLAPTDASGAPSTSARVKAYVGLTKPRIIELLLITTVPAMILAARGWPSPWLILATLVGGSLTAGSANSINCYLDRDIDEKMERTSSRPLPRHAVSPLNALRFGVGLGAAGFVWLWVTTNLAAALLAAAAVLFYVFVYTLWMKRSTPSNIVIGGAAGAAPALVGWAAVTGGLSRPAWVLFAVIFYWTPPHFWALALRYRDQYAAAEVPMLPVVKGVAETTRQMLLYSFVLVATSLFLLPVGGLGYLYLVVCTVLGGVFIAYAVRLRSAPDEKRAMSLFHFSISYLVLLFTAVAVDALIDRPAPDVVFRATLAVAGVLFFFSQAALVASVVGSGRVGASPVAEGPVLP